MKSHILKAWCASFVRRWHTHPQLCDTVDYNSGHQQRTALLILSFWPDASRNLLVAAMLHDQGECDSGDMAHPAKRKHPEIRELLRNVEMDSIASQGFEYPGLTPWENAALSFCDLLDSYLWMIRHKPHLAHDQAWVDQLEKMFKDARAAGILKEFRALISAAERTFK